MSVLRAVKLLSLIRGIVKGDYEQVSDLMGGLHGFPQKLGQHLTLYGDDFDRYFDALYTKSKTEDVAIENIIDELELAPQNIEISAQASIGQVYRVTTADGVMAVKVKYPGVEKKITSDFNTLNGLLWPTRLLPLKNSSILPLLEHLKLMLLRECDYPLEAENQQIFYQLFKEDEEISVPEVVNYNDRALVSRWAAGRLLSESPDSADRWFVGTYLTFILKSLKQLGMIHTDPHPGNFIITAVNNKRELTVLDYGSVVCFNEPEADAIRRLLLGSYDNEPDLLDDLRILGVNDETLEMYRPIAGDLVSVLFEPFYYEGEYDFINWRLQYKVNTLLASKGWEKPLNIPLKLLLFLRAFQGLYFYARRNCVLFNWHDEVKKQLG